MANILGINLSELNAPEVQDKITGFLAGAGQHYLVTPNPEIILTSHHDEELFYILNKADLALADGFGLRLAGLLNGESVRRVTGADLIGPLLARAAERGNSVVILHWRGGLSPAAVLDQTLKSKYPSLTFKILEIDRIKFLPTDALRTVNEFKPAILLADLGCPYQEKIIFHNLSKLPSVRIGLAIGGALDFLTGRAVRAPRILRAAGLEWLWRLFRQPSRWRRIYNATIVFTAQVLKNRFLNPLLYRANVAILLYKEEGVERKILLVARQDNPAHWQLPQGGTDGEDIVTAGCRELGEETGVLPEHLEVRGVFKNIYRYNFRSRWQEAEAAQPEIAVTSYRVRRYDYKGQKQSLLIAKFTGPDDEIHINFWDHAAWKWTASDRLVEEVYPTRRTGAKIFLDKFRSLGL